MSSSSGGVVQADLGPVDSLRFAAIAGAELTSGDDPFSSESVDPVLGGVFMGILGRHGFDDALRHEWNGGDVRPYGMVGDSTTDAMFYDLAYLFRVAPVSYAADTTAASYLTFELGFRWLF